MGNSEAKYAEYRTIIDKSLETTKGAKIALSATRAGDQIKIVASAELTEKAVGETARAASQNECESRQEIQGRADSPSGFSAWHLTEESIHYVGGNKLRYHHHVVRALPGGAKGKELKDGKGKIEVTVNLADLKRDLEKYLSDFTKTRAVSQPAAGDQARQARRRRVRSG